MQLKTYDGKFLEKIDKAIQLTKNIDEKIGLIPEEDRLWYLSPEQTGRLYMIADERSRFYTLGIMLFELFIGKKLFSEVSDMQVVYSHITVKPPTIISIDSSLPKTLSLVVEKLLSKNPDERYQSTSGVVYDLEHLFDADFVVASQDRSMKFVLPKKLYGREKVLASIKNSLESEEKSLVIIDGVSGIGKSILINTAIDELNDNSRVYVFKKFEQQKDMQTFNAVSAILSELIKKILLREPEEINTFTKRILNELEENIQLMVEFIPVLKILIDKEYKLATLQANESQNRFNGALLKFVQIVTSYFDQTVWIVDDMQWSDSATIAMMRLILNDRNILNVKFIVMYRSDEVDKHHNLQLLLDSFPQLSNHLKVHLDVLNREDILEMLTDMFFFKDKQLEELANILKSKTEGNPFFLSELLLNLYEENLFFLDENDFGWSYEIEKIKEVKISDNVVNLVNKKIDNDADKLKNILKFASLMGSVVNIGELSSILGVSRVKLEADLDQHNAIGFVFFHKENCFKFIHDKVQEAFSKYVNTKEKEEFHLNAGNYYLKSEEADIFVVTDHLNKAKNIIPSKDQKLELVHLNYRCAVRSLQLNSYANSIAYLKYAIALQEKNSWQTDYDMSLKLNQLLAESYYLNLQFAEAHNVFEMTLSQTLSIKDRVKLIQIEIFSLIAQNRMNEALELGLDILSQYGIDMPEEDDLSLYYPKLFELYDTSKIEKLAELPALKDQEKLDVLDILNSIMSPAYLTAPHIYPKICFKAIEICIKEGNSAAATNVYAVHALLLSAFFNEFEQAQEFAYLSQTLIEIYDAQAYSAKVDMIANACVSHWNNPLSETLCSLHDTVQKGINIGDFEYACYGEMYYTLYSTLSGEPISQLDKKYSAQKKTMTSLQQTYQLLYVSVWEEFLTGLKSNKGEFGKLEGSSFSERKTLTQLKDSNSFSILYNLYFAKSMLSLFGEDIQNAKVYIGEAKKYHIGVASLYQFGEFYFFEVLIEYRYYKLYDSGNKKELLSLLTEAIAYYEMLCLTSPSNNEHKVFLLKALEKEICGDESCYKDFEKAAQKAYEEKFLHHAAICYQFAFYFWTEQSMPEFAQTYFGKFYSCYSEWGASGIVEHFQKNKHYSPKTADKSSTLLDKYDVNSIVKAFNLLSNELSVEELLKKVISILIENSASQNGYIFLENEGLLKPAVAYKDGLHSMDINNDSLPLNIVNYVQNTQNDLLYSIGLKDDVFDQEAYIVNNGIKSIFSTNIVFQGENKGVLYLENRDIVHLYTPDKIELIKLLITQSAISIENASLFEKTKELNQTLELKVEQRTKEIVEKTEVLESTVKELEYISSYDVMTNVYNRRKFFELAYDFFETQNSVYAVIIDIDDFKYVNDNYGHPFGDSVIKAVAMTINNLISEKSIFARIGGEEFAMLCLSDSPMKMIEEQENICQAVENIELFNDDKERVTVTISSGISEKTEIIDTLEALLKEADEALYLVKNNGKNRARFKS